MSLITTSDNTATNNRNLLLELMSNEEITAGQALSRSMQINGISKAITIYLKTKPVKKATVKQPATATQDNSKYPSRPAKKAGVTSCNTNCNNGDCYRTYDTGKQKHFQVSPTYNPLNSQWEFNPGPC